MKLLLKPGPETHALHCKNTPKQLELDAVSFRSAVGGSLRLHYFGGSKCVLADAVKL